jgi:hypothetical protein
VDGGLVFGFTTGRFSSVYFDSALGGLIVGFIVKTWPLSNHRPRLIETVVRNENAGLRMLRVEDNSPQECHD